MQRRTERERNEFYSHCRESFIATLKIGDKLLKIEDLPESEQVFVEQILSNVKKLETIISDRINGIKGAETDIT